MPPVQFSAWFTRTSDSQQEVQPYKKYCFVGEGNTERWYFEHLALIKNDLGISSLIGICWEERTGNEQGHSSPQQLLDQGIQATGNADLQFNKSLDVIVLVFDLDHYINNPGQRPRFQALLTEMEALDFHCTVAVTNPNFELFLLLHRLGSYESIIKPIEAQIIAPKPEHEDHITKKLVSTHFGMNSTTNNKIGTLAEHVRTAIQQEEQFMNRDTAPDIALNHLTSNVGQCIQAIMDDNVPETTNSSELLEGTRN